MGRLTDVINDLLFEQVSTGGHVGVRLATAKGRETKKVLRQPVKTILVSIPWLVAALAIWFWAFNGSQTAGASLGLGLYKTILAVLSTWIADFSLFWFIPASQNNTAMAQIRRAVIFLGVCWLLSIA